MLLLPWQNFEKAVAERRCPQDISLLIHTLRARTYTHWKLQEAIYLRETTAGAKLALDRDGTAPEGHGGPLHPPAFRHGGLKPNCDRVYMTKPSIGKFDSRPNRCMDLY